MPPRRAPVQPESDDDDDELVLSKEDFSVMDFEDPFHPVYTEMEYFRSPNDAIKRRINALNLAEFKDAVTFKTVANFELRSINTMDIEPVSKEALKSGAYQSGRSHSDKEAAGRINAMMNKYPSFAQYKNQDDLTWITRRHRLLICEMLEDIVARSIRKSTVETELYAILRVMEQALGEYHVLYGKINAMYLLIRADIREEEGNNKLNRIEQERGWLDWNTVLQKQEELENAFNEVPDKKTKAAYTLNQNLLLLSMYCLIPPLRAEVKTLKFEYNPTTNWEDRSGNLVVFEGDDIFLELH